MSCRPQAFLFGRPDFRAGPDQPPDRWSKYQGFDSFSEDVAEARWLSIRACSSVLSHGSSDQVLEVQEKNLVSCEEKCVRQDSRR